jgi:ABC-type lipoprotein release transport system permease subunit
MKTSAIAGVFVFHGMMISSEKMALGTILGTVSKNGIYFLRIFQ